MQTFQPRITALVPERWVVKETIQLLAPDLRANVIASGEPLEPDMDLQSYADAQGQLLKEFFPSYTEHELSSAKMFGGRDVLLRRFEWIAPVDMRVAQVQIYYVEGGRGFTATATVEEGRLEQFQSSLAEIMAGLRLAGVGYAAAGPLRHMPDDPRERAYALLERGELTSEPAQAPQVRGDRPLEEGNGSGEGAWASSATAWKAVGAGFRT